MSHTAYVLNALEKGAAPLKVLCSRTNMSPDAVKATVGMLVDRGRVLALANGWYRLPGHAAGPGAEARVGEPADAQPLPGQHRREKRAAPIAPRSIPVAVNNPTQAIHDLLSEEGPLHYRRIMEATGLNVHDIMRATEAGAIQFDIESKQYHV